MDIQSKLAYDADLLLDDGVDTVISASAGGRVAATAKIVDLGADWANIPMIAAQVNIEKVSSAGTKKVSIQNGDATLAAITAETSTFVTGPGNYIFAFKPMNRYVRVYYTVATGGEITKGKAGLNYIA